MDIAHKVMTLLKKPPSIALTDVQQKKMSQIIKRVGPDATIINIGSKNTLVFSRVINIDLIPYKNVHLVSNAETLALKDECADVLFIIALLEIVEEPDTVISEIYRVLKPGGIVVATTPFMQSYHPDPVDTHRFTIHGTQRLFRNFGIEEIMPTRGVFGSFLCLMKDYMAIFLSFNSIFLWKVLNIVIPWILFPLKYIDRIMPAYQKAEYVVSSFTIIARKPQIKDKI